MNEIYSNQKLSVKEKEQMIENLLNNKISNSFLIFTLKLQPA